MSSHIEDRRPFVAAMQNYHLLDVDATASQASLNIPEDNGRKYRAERPGIFGINLRVLFTLISVVFFILALILFIGTIVAYYSRPSQDVLQGEQHSNATGSTAEGWIYGKDKTLSPNKNSDEKGKAPGGPTPSPPPGEKFETQKWSVTTVNNRHTRPGELIFQDEFETFNTSTWFHYTGDSDNHFYFNVNNRSNSFVKDGILYLKPTYTADRFGSAYVQNGTLLLGSVPDARCVNQSALCWKGSGAIVHPIMAPMILSKNFFKFKYGKLQIRAKMPGGDWIEPIISLQPDQSSYGADLLNGQVHLVDTRGNKKLFNTAGLNVGSEQTCPDIRFGTKEMNTVAFYCVNTDDNQGFDKEFHVYEVEWTPRTITIKIDDEGIVSAPFPRPSMYKLWSKGRPVRNPWTASENHVMAPFDRSFYVVFGLSIGGHSGFFSEDHVNQAYPKPWNNTDPLNAPKSFWDARKSWEPTWDNGQSALQIDFIRLYSLNETLSD